MAEERKEFPDFFETSPTVEIKQYPQTRYRSHYTLGVKILFTAAKRYHLSVCVDEVKIEIEWRQ